MRALIVLRATVLAGGPGLHWLEAGAVVKAGRAAMAACAEPTLGCGGGCSEAAVGPALWACAPDRVTGD